MLLSVGFSFSEAASCASVAGLREDLEVPTPSLECEDYSLLPPCSVYMVLGAKPMCAGNALCQINPQSNDLLNLFPLRLKEKAQD